MKKSILALIIVMSGLGSAQAADPTLYERIGGIHPIAALLDDFTNRLLTDPKIVGPLSQHIKIMPEQMKVRVPGLKYLLTEQVGMATGGPMKYTGGDMKSVHQGMLIDDSQWDAMVADLTASFDKFKVPDEMRGELVALLAPTKKDIVTGEKIRQRPTMRATAGPDAKLYDRLGGIYGIAYFVDEFINALLKDPTIGGNPKVVAALDHVTPAGIKFLLTEQIASMSGGPQKYVGRTMKESHKDLGITEKEWETGGKIAVETMQKLKLGKREQDELIAAISKLHGDIVKK